MKTWEVSTDGRQIYNTDFTNDATLELTGDFQSAAHRMEYANLLADKLNRRMKPLTDEEIVDIWADDWPEGVAFEDVLALVRVIERAHGVGGQDDKSV